MDNQTAHLFKHALESITQQKAEVTELKKNLDDLCQLIFGILISFMQLGFACLEAGFVRKKNTTNIFFQNFLDLFICFFWYWLIGYSLSYGPGNRFFGSGWWAGYDFPETLWAHWFFQFIFAATAATILTGAVAERCNTICYLSYCSLITGVVYPIVAHWTWSPDGWLNQLGYKDFSGAGTVHVVGGTASLFGALIIGPRIGRFTNPRDESLQSSHSTMLIGIGTILLISGFLAFNGGSLGRMSEHGDTIIISKAICNTIMSGFGGAVIMIAVGYIGIFGPSHWPYSTTVNGCLAGMVAICGSPDTYTIPESLIIGIIGSLIYFLLHYVIIFCKVDDPLDAAPLHFGAGSWGVIAAGIFSEKGLIKNSSFQLGLKQLGIHAVGLCCIFLWTAIWITILFYILKLAHVLRVSADDELTGLDISKHHEEAYAEESTKNDEKYAADQKFVQNGFDNFAAELEHQHKC